MMVILNRWLGDFICFGKFCCFPTVACTQQPISQRRKTSFYDEVWLVKTHADSTALENFSLQQQIANSLSSWVWDCRQETLWREAIMTTNSSDSNVQRGPWKAGQSLRALCHEAKVSVTIRITCYLLCQNGCAATAKTWTAGSVN